VCKDLKYVYVKFVHVDLQKCIICPKNSGKGRQKWNKACVENGIFCRKLNTLVKTRYSFLFHYYFNNLQILRF
jgi:hypothetical protein